MKATNRSLYIKGLFLFRLAAALLAATSSASAVSDTWVGNTDANWSTAANWTFSSGSAVNPSGDSLFFGVAGSSGSVLNNDLSGYSFSGITFTNGASAFVLSGNPFSLTGGITNLSTASPIVNNNITLTGDQTVSDTGTGTLTLGGVIDDAGNGYGLTFPGNRNVVLTNANTYSGATKVRGGTLVFANIGSISNSSITLGQAGSTSGGYMTVSANTQPAGTIFIASNLNITASVPGGGNNFANLNANGTSAGNIIEQFSGGLNLSNGLFRVLLTPNSGANLQYVFNGFSRAPGTVWAFDRSTAPGVNLISSVAAASANFIFNTAPALQGAGTIGTTTAPILQGVAINRQPATYDSNFGLRTLQSGEFTTVAAVNGIVGSPAPNVQWTGSGAPNADQNLTGDTEMNSLWMNESHIIKLNSHTLTIDSGFIGNDVFGVIGAAANDGVIQLGAEGFFACANTRSMTINSVIAGNNGLTIYLEDFNNTTANVVLAATNTFTGVTRVLGNNAAQVVNLNNALALQNSTLDYNNYGGSIKFNGPSSFTFGGLKGAQNLAITVPLTLGGDGDSTTYSGVLSGAGSLTKVGAGSFALTGANTYSGGTTLSTGQLNINNGGSSSANSAIGTAALTIAGGSIDNTSGTNVTLAPNNAQNWNGDFTFIGTTNLNLGAGLVTLGGNRQVIVNANTLTVGGAISGTGFGLTKNGNGTLVLSGANTYTGNTTINGGALALAGSGSIGNSLNVSVSSGATLDVSSVSFTLAGSQTLSGSGTNNGSVGSSSGSKVYAGADGTYGTNTFNNDLTLASGAAAYFDLGTIANGSNDKIAVGGNLTLSGNTIHIKAPSASVNLDANDYTLFTVNGGISGSASVTPVWDVQPLNSANYSIVTSGNSVRLHYSNISNPAGIGSANPNPVARNQTTVITVTMTAAGSSPVSTVTVNASPIGGSSSVTLVQVDATASYTNTVTVGSSVASGSTPLTATITDTDSGSASVMVPLTVSAGSATWNGGGLDDNWTTSVNWIGGISPLAGDATTFAGTTRLTPLMDSSFNLGPVTFDATAGSFVITNASGDTLTLSGNGVTNNSVNVQSLNVPIAMSAAQTFNAAGGDIALGEVVSGTSVTKVGTNALILSGTNTYGNGTTVNAGTVVIANNSALGSGTLVLNGGGAISNAAGNSYSAPNSVAVAGAANVAVGAGDTLTLSGTISGGANLVKIGNGSLNLPSANSISGGVTVHGGTLVVGNNNAIGSSVLTLGNASISNSAGASYTVANTINLSGSASAVVGAGDALTLSGIITNSGSLTKTGNGTLTISGNNANTYSGGTMLTAGFLDVENTSVSPLGAGTLTLAGGSLENNNVSLGVTISNNVYVATNTTTTLPTGGITLAGNISGPGNIVIAGTATQDTLTGDNSGFTGTLTVNNGASQRFAFGSPTAGSPNASFVFNSTGVDNQKFIFGNGTISFGSLSGAGQCRNDAAGLTIIRVGDLNTSTAFSGTFVNNGASRFGFLKVGTGTWTITASQGYTGPTTISNGVLALANNPITLVDGAIPGTTNIYIASGAALDVSGRSDQNISLSGPQILRGNGSVNGNLDNYGGGTIAPGDGLDGNLGTLTVTNTLSLGATTWMKLNRTSVPNSDRLVATNINYGGTLVVSNVGSMLRAGDTFTLFSSANPPAGAFSLVLPNYYVWDTSNLGVNGTISVLSATPPVISSVDFSALATGSITINATNGLPGGLLIVLTTTNLALPVSAWTPVVTNYFDGSGNYMETITVDPTPSRQFYMLEAQ